MTIDNIVAKFNQRYTEAYEVWVEVFGQADRSLRFYLGDQYNGEELAQLRRQGREAFVFNKIFRNINTLTGYQIQHRNASIVTPRGGGSPATASICTKLLSHIFNFNNGYELISECFAGSLKTGMNLMHIWVDYRTDPLNGDIKLTRQPFSAYILDPFFTQKDLSDCNYIITRKLLSRAQTASMLPKHREFIENTATPIGNQDEKFTWIAAAHRSYSHKLLAVDEFWERDFEQRGVVVDLMSNTQQLIARGNEKEAKKITEKNPALFYLEQQRSVIKKHILINGYHLESTINPYGFNRLPFVPFFCIFEPESEYWSLKFASLVSIMADAQRESNRRRSQISNILESQLTSGWIYTEGSVKDVKQLFKSGQGQVISRSPGFAPADLQPIAAPTLPPGLFELQRLYDQDLIEVGGLNDSAFGEASARDESSLLMNMRQSSMLTSTQIFFENLRYAQKTLSEFVLSFAQQWSAEKIEQITGQQPEDDFYEPYSLKYDIAVQEGLLTPTQQQLYFRQLIELAQIGVKLPPSVMIDASPIQNKEELLQQLAEQEKQEKAQADAQAEQQSRVVEAEIERRKARAMSDVGLSKERLARALSNLGLEEERVSQSQYDKAKSLLAIARSLKDLEGMDAEQLARSLQLIETLDKKNQEEEDKAKEELESKKPSITGNEMGVNTQTQEGVSTPSQPANTNTNIDVIKQFIKTSEDDVEGKFR